MKNGIIPLKRSFQKHGNISKEKSQRSKNKAKSLQLRLFLSLKKGKLRAKHSKSSRMAGQAPFLAKDLFTFLLASIFYTLFHRQKSQIQSQKP